jgi:hypothetical protein
VITEAVGAFGDQKSFCEWNLIVAGAAACRLANVRGAPSDFAKV